MYAHLIHIKLSIILFWKVEKFYHLYVLIQWDIMQIWTGLCYYIKIFHHILEYSQNWYENWS